MKYKASFFSGFVIGCVGFLLMFKLIFLDSIPPEDELAPGIVVLAAVLSGGVLGLVGQVIQKYFARESQ